MSEPRRLYWVGDSAKRWWVAASETGQWHLREHANHTITLRFNGEVVRDFLPSREAAQVLAQEMEYGGPSFDLTPELIAPDAVDAVRAVLRTARWIRDEAVEDPAEVERLSRGMRIVETWLRERLKGDAG